METFEAKLKRVLSDEVALTAYDPAWPQMFAAERAHLLNCLPAGLLGRIEHFGSTAVPGLIAKPVVDMLVEVAELESARAIIAPILEAQGYDYFWRPSHGENSPPFYAWFIKRDVAGRRTHHLHMGEPHFEHWQRLYFRDYLIEFPEIARQYAELKQRLAAEFPHDRLAYTVGKTEFIESVTREALRHYGAGGAVIRPAQAGDTEAVIAIWLAASRQAHDFIAYAFWLARAEDMRTVYLPRAETHVCEEAGVLVGFVSLIDNYLAALFVDPAGQSRGHGRRLLAQAQRLRPRLELCVYERNLRALTFYESAGFRRVARQIDAASGQPEIVMEWCPS